MIPKTLAVKITEKTYPIAVACLTTTFASQPADRFIDKYWLVINDHIFTTIPAIFGGQKSITLSNSYMTEREFKDKYTLVEYKDPNDYKDGEFMEIVRAK